MQDPGRGGETGHGRRGCSKSAVTHMFFQKGGSSVAS